jgi:hypothetical protein
VRKKLSVPAETFGVISALQEVVVSDVRVDVPSRSRRRSKFVRSLKIFCSWAEGTAERMARCRYSRWILACGSARRRRGEQSILTVGRKFEMTGRTTDSGSPTVDAQA